MKRTLKLKPGWIILCLILTVAWMAVIFGFSAQTALESGSLSALIAEPVTKWLAQLAGGMTAEAEAALYLQVHIVVRKLAHFTEYAILGGLLVLLGWQFRIRRFKRVIPLWMLGTVYAALDEWHQSFTPGRACSVWDVLIDSCGVLCGVVVFNLILHAWRRKYVHDQ